MLFASHSRYIRDACTRIPFAHHHSALIALFTDSRQLRQSRHFHVGPVSSVASNETRASHGTTSTTPQTEPKKKRASPTNRSCLPWSEDENERFRYLYSDGKDPTVASIMALFPDRSRSALYNRLLHHRKGIIRNVWTAEDEARLLELHNAGVSTVDLFKHFPGRTQQAVSSKLNRALPGSCFSNRKRMVSLAVLGEKNRGNGGEQGGDQDEGAILTTTPIRRRQTFWTDEEDDALRQLARNAKERNPDRWTAELSRLLSDPKERKGLNETRTQAMCTMRLKRLEAQPFIVRAPWTESENNLLTKSVYSRLGVQLNSVFNPPSKSHQEPKGNDGLSQSERPTGALKNHIETVEWPEVSLEELKSLDWNQVSLDVGTRDSHGCRQRFNSRFNITKYERWTVDETELLKEGLRKYGRDWTAVASVVGTRTATQALMRYKHLDRLSTRSKASLGKDTKK